MKNIIMAAVSKAVEALYNLDIKLANHFVGKPDHPNDQAVAGVRRIIRHALDTLHSADWLPFAAGIDKGKDWKEPDGRDQTFEGRWFQAGYRGGCPRRGQNAGRPLLRGPFQWCPAVQLGHGGCRAAGHGVCLCRDYGDSSAFKEALQTVCDGVGNEYDRHEAVDDDGHQRYTTLLTPHEY